MCLAEAFTTSGDEVSRGHFAQLAHPAGDSRPVTTVRTTSSMADRDKLRDMMTEY